MSPLEKSRAYAIPLFLLAALLFFHGNAEASDLHPTSNEALSHCESQFKPGHVINAAYTAKDFICDHSTGAKTYTCRYTGDHATAPDAGPYSCNYWPTNSALSPLPGGDPTHSYTTLSEDPECTAGEETRTSAQTTVDGDGKWDINIPTSGCKDYCQYSDPSVGPEDHCWGAVADPSDTWCDWTLTATGEVCEYGDANELPGVDSNSGAEPATCYTDVAGGCGPGSEPNWPPGGGSGSGGSGSGSGGDGNNDGSGGTGGGVPAQNPPGGGSGGDGDPDTPDGDGQGSGDTDGDGNRDIDCNPLSNPDCAYQGGASGAADCSAQPTCSGDPVNCAILYQIWASACLAMGHGTVPAGCSQPMQCYGSWLECQQLIMMRKQHCDLFVGDGSEGDHTDDELFETDLKDEAEEVEIASSFDDSGYGGGSCPGPQTINLGIASFSVSYWTFCELADMMRPLVLLLAYMSGILIVVRARPS